jgi:hypothetical protein
VEAATPTAIPRTSAQRSRESSGSRFSPRRFDLDLNTFFTGFTFIFVPALVFLLGGGMFAATWVVIGFFEKIMEGFRLNAQLSRPVAVSPMNAVAREEVLRLRSQDDAERRERLREARAQLKTRMRRTTASETHRLETPVIDQTGEVDCTDELFNEGKKFLICRNPLTNPEYFAAFLRGHFTESGPRDCRYVWTCVRSLARRFGQAEALSAIETLPGRKNLFVVPLEPDASTVALANLRTVEKKALDSVNRSQHVSTGTDL